MQKTVKKYGNKILDKDRRIGFNTKMEELA